MPSILELIAQMPPMLRAADGDGTAFFPQFGRAALEWLATGCYPIYAQKVSSVAADKRLEKSFSRRDGRHTWDRGPYLRLSTSKNRHMALGPVSVSLSRVPVL